MDCATQGVTTGIPLRVCESNKLMLYSRKCKVDTAPGVPRNAKDASEAGMMEYWNDGIVGARKRDFAFSFASASPVGTTYL